MNFTASEEQVKQIELNAIKASKPVMLGYLATDVERSVTLDDLEIDENGLDIDYFRGNTVKLLIHRGTKNQWQLNDFVDFEYQSWVRVYPTAKALVESVLGVLQ